VNRQIALAQGVSSADADAWNKFQKATAKADENFAVGILRAAEGVAGFALSGLSRWWW
jgi:hypothetical protein